MGVHNLDIYPAVKKLLDVSPEEPIFIIRGQDRLAQLALIAYDTAATGAGCSDQFMSALVATRSEFKAFQEKYPGRVKVPD